VVTESLDPRNARAYRRRAAPFLLPAYLLVLAGIGAIANPDSADRTTVARLLPASIELVWQVSYILAGLLITAGVLWPRRPQPAFEAIGDWVAIWALAVNLLALLAVRGIAASGMAPFAYVLTATLLALRIADLHASAKTPPPAWPGRLERRHVDLGPQARVSRP
jgi:hypothetical protein